MAKRRDFLETEPPPPPLPDENTVPVSPAPRPAGDQVAPTGGKGTAGTPGGPGKNTPTTPGDPADALTTPGGAGKSGLMSGTPNLAPGDPMLPDPTVGGGFADPNVRPVAGVNSWQNWAAGNLPGMMGPTDLETASRLRLRQGIDEGQQRVTGAGLPGGPEGTNPAFEATRRAFEAMTIPQIRQSRTMMGLGDSNAVTNDISRAWAGVLPSLVESELGREERGIERGISSRFTGAQGLAGLSAQQTARETGATDRGFGFGTAFRGIAEEGNRAVYDDFLRRQGLAERLLFTPFGQAPGTIGTESETGGLFK
jgi:hypothetical protein